MGGDDRTGDPTEALVAGMDAANARVGAAQHRLLELIAEADRSEVWVDSGAQGMAHFLCMRYGISYWKAERWIRAAHALRGLPVLARAFRDGEVSIDKVVELARFATPETEAELTRWAEGVSAGRIRRRAELAARPSIEETRGIESARHLSWWYLDEGRRLGLEAELPAAEGAMVVDAIARVAAGIPAMPGEEGPGGADARRADALVALCSGDLGVDPVPDRASVVVHAPLEALASGAEGCAIEGGGILHPATVRRLACSGRTQVVVEDGAADVVGLGRRSREPSAFMLRQLRHRDGECRFPGCGARRFTQAHHIVWWSRGGRTDLGNLVLLCFFHHKLVHEHGWRLARADDGTVRWRWPDGRPYRPGPAPPGEVAESPVQDDRGPLDASEPQAAFAGFG